MASGWFREFFSTVLHLNGIAARGKPRKPNSVDLLVQWQALNPQAFFSRESAILVSVPHILE